VHEELAEGILTRKPFVTNIRSICFCIVVHSNVEYELMNISNFTQVICTNIKTGYI